MKIIKTLKLIFMKDKIIYNKFSLEPEREEEEQFIHFLNKSNILNKKYKYITKKIENKIVKLAKVIDTILYYEYLTVFTNSEKMRIKRYYFKFEKDFVPEIQKKIMSKYSKYCIPDIDLYNRYFFYLLEKVEKIKI